VSQDNTPNDPSVEENELIRQRREKLGVWRESFPAYPNTFKPEHLATDLLSQYGEMEKEALEEAAVEVSVAGRMMSRRIMGKASFAHIQDRSGRLQLYVQRDVLADGFYNEQFKKWDIGDIIAGKGTLFKTNKGELSVKLSHI